MPAYSWLLPLSADWLLLCHHRKPYLSSHQIYLPIPYWTTALSIRACISLLRITEGNMTAVFISLFCLFLFSFFIFMAIKYYQQMFYFIISFVMLCYMLLWYCYRLTAPQKCWHNTQIKHFLQLIKIGFY